ncbi:uncharacterized protein F5891DRAFT_1276512 [Suillus fuscotomentosus]|uniref:Uncharacterized protein n=1 Tax=Suillus fuscotomentosus TaxID=1912939 RepID=A0AAD4EEC7_9AGAM|nr:uncharacterized protein F5891DRAFT_1276512 [Suillus fuscotomentosus]KAG1903378.1 hypothetical protein F5891DRAFT_1276512 [Suillus fuscotomentosus]
MSSVTLRIMSLWVILFSISAMVAASPTPIDPQLASLITNNMNLNCGQSCQEFKGTQQLNKNFALTSASSSNSFVLGAILLAGGVLVA